MPAALLIDHNDRFVYPSRYKPTAGICDVQVYHTDARDFVLVSELIRTDGCYANPGMSVTNAIEVIAVLALMMYDLHPQRTTWIEHYPERGPNLHRRVLHPVRLDPTFAESFAIVSFEWQQTGRGLTLSAPYWDTANRQQVEAMIGQPFVVEYVTDTLIL